MTPAELRNSIREIADPLIEQGATFGEVNDALEQRLGIRMGHGGPGGTGSGSTECRYCRKTGNGGHGGFCPDSGNWQ